MMTSKAEGGRSFPIGWIILFILALILAYLVDEGQTHLGIPDYIWLPVNLILFLYVLSRLVGKPMMASLDARKEGIAEELQNARQQLEEADRLQADAGKRLADVEGLRLSVDPDPNGCPFSRARLAPDPQQTGHTAASLTQALAAGDPTVVARAHHVDEGYLHLDAIEMTDEEIEFTCAKVKTILAREG